MKANPGGIVAPENVIGRDQLIARIWSTLEQQSLSLMSERRMGKTTVIRKMEAETPDSTSVWVTDVGGVSSPIEFVEKVAQNVESHLNAFQKTAKRAQAMWTALGGVEIGGVIKFPEAAAPRWKDLLERVLGYLADYNDQQAILIWDELPWMLQKIIKTTGQEAVMDLLDTLRGLRQMHANLRMVYTGSIGLHHVISALRDDGYLNSPVNDMRTIEVPPLDLQDAQDLAKELIQGEGFTCDTLNETAIVIARLVDAIPFYIHHVVAAMKDRGQIATPEIAKEVVAESLADAPDWDLEHFRSRLREYYGERATLVRSVLDELSEVEPLLLDELHERIKVNLKSSDETTTRIAEGNREALRTLLKLLQRDHYLHQDREGGYRFRFGIIRRWWRLDRGRS